MEVGRKQGIKIREGKELSTVKKSKLHEIGRGYQVTCYRKDLEDDISMENQGRNW